MPLIKYCTTTDAKAYNPARVYNTSSIPTSTQFTAFVTNISGEMNARMAAVGIAVPISTSPATYASLFLKRTASLGAAADAEDAVFSGGNKIDSSHGELLRKMYEKNMKMIEDNASIVTGDGGAVLDSYELSNTDEQRDIEPFERSEQQW